VSDCAVWLGKINDGGISVSDSQGTEKRPQRVMKRTIVHVRHEKNNAVLTGYHTNLAEVHSSRCCHPPYQDNARHHSGQR
jgi:hypothetical protein